MADLENKPATRVPLELTVEFRKSYARQIDLGTLNNISITGAYVKSSEAAELKRRDKLCITFSVGGRSRKIYATVVWTNNLGAGIKFQHFNNRDLQIIDDLMYFVEASRKTRRSLLDNIFKKVA